MPSTTHHDERVDPWFAFERCYEIDVYLDSLRADAERALHCALLAKRRGDVFGHVLSDLLLCSYDDYQSLAMAVKSGRMRLVLMVARALLEGAVNGMRIATGGSEVAQLAMDHAGQKYFRDLDRHSKIGESVVRYRHRLASVEEFAARFQSGLRRFTNKSGRELRDWIDESFEDKLAIICKEIRWADGVRLQLAALGIYRHSSEVIHGTYCGAGYALGEDARLTLGTSAEDPRPKRRQERVAIAVESASAAMSLLVQVVARAVGALILAEQAAEAYRKEMDLMEKYYQSRGASPAGGIDQQTSPRAGSTD